MPFLGIHTCDVAPNKPWIKDSWPLIQAPTHRRHEPVCGQQLAKWSLKSETLPHSASSYTPKHPYPTRHLPRECPHVASFFTWYFFRNSPPVYARATPTSLSINSTDNPLQRPPLRHWINKVFFRFITDSFSILKQILSNFNWFTLSLTNLSLSD